MNPYTRMKESMIREAELGIYETDDEPIISFLSEGESDKCIDSDVAEMEENDEFSEFEEEVY